MSVVEVDLPVSEDTGADDEPETPPARGSNTVLHSRVKSLPFWGVHVAALLVFLVPFAWKWVGMAVALYYLRMFAVTAGYHRYFSHRTYKTSRVFQFLLAFVGSTALQKGVLWWAAHHRHHHRFSDQEDDLHSPTLRGFWWSHVGWILSPRYEETDYARIRDYARFPELVWLNKYHLVPPVLMFAAIFAAFGLTGLAWSFASTVALWHGTFTINSLSHVFGTVRYKTTDTSKNNFWLALITMGEGWHNNHHYYQASANQGFFWWEVDATYYILVALEKLGVVWDVKRPSKAVIEGDRVSASGAAAPSEPARAA